MNITRAVALPSPNTTCVRPWCNLHFVHGATSAARSASAPAASRSGSGCGEEEGGEELLGDGVPEVGVLEPAAFTGSGGRCEPGGHAEGTLPV